MNSPGFVYGYPLRMSIMSMSHGLGGKLLSLQDVSSLELALWERGSLLRDLSEDGNEKLKVCSGCDKRLVPHNSFTFLREPNNCKDCFSSPLLNHP